MAWSAKLAGTHDLGALRAPAQHPSPPPCASRAQCVPLSSKAVVRGAGCPSRACPDLWEPRVGNCPRPPSVKTTDLLGPVPALRRPRYEFAVVAGLRQIEVDARRCPSIRPSPLLRARVVHEETLPDDLAWSRERDPATIASGRPVVLDTQLHRWTSLQSVWVSGSPWFRSFQRPLSDDQGHSLPVPVDLVHIYT